jgi:hypothetical protein
MTGQSRPILLLIANAICLAIAAAIVFYAVRDWPARYATHTLSWAVTGFFICFVALTITGSLALVAYMRAKNGLLLKLAQAPLYLLVFAIAIGLFKALITGDP